MARGAEPEPGDYGQLQGRWTVVQCEREGAATPALNGSVFTYEGKTVRLGTEPGSENYVLHEDTNPKGIDYVDGHNPPVLGIYKFEGETLFICSADPGHDRPKTFHTAANEGTTLIQMRRAK
jgi:uncharacterized protein (TIGR03067 family)